MPHSEYKVIQTNNAEQLQEALTKHAPEGWKPLLLNTCLGGAGYQILIILEKKTSHK